MKYVFNVSHNKIVCVSHFAGKAVRGVAKCDPNFDEFNLETGKSLSQKRCDVKVFEKRVKRATQRLTEAIEAYNAAKKLVARMTSYRNDAVIQLAEAQKDLREFEECL